MLQLILVFGLFEIIPKNSFITCTNFIFNFIFWAICVHNLFAICNALNAHDITKCYNLFLCFYTTILYIYRLLDFFYFEIVAYSSAKDTPTFLLGLERLAWNFSLYNTIFGLPTILIVSLYQGT